MSELLQASNGTPAPAAPEATPDTALAAPIEPAAATPPATEEKAPSPKDDPKFAAKFGALARREKALFEKERAIKEQQSKFTTYEQEQKLIEENPLAYLEKRGWTFDKLTKLALNDGKKPPEVRVQELEERLEREKVEREQSEIKAAESRADQQRQAYLAEIGDFLAKNSSTYQLAAASDEAIELAYNVTAEHFSKHKRILPIEEAVKYVESYFDSIIEEKYLKLDKIKSKFAPKEAPPAAPAAPKQGTSTLTNTQAAQAPTPSQQAAMDVEASKRKAAQLLRWV